MQSWGKTSAGKQRFFCPLCRKSSIRTRPDLRLKIDFRIFVYWLTQTTGLVTMAKKYHVSVSNITKSFKTFWQFLPQPKSIVGNSRVLIVDGVTVVKHQLVALVVFDRIKKITLSWFYVLRESYSGWRSIFLELKSKGIEPEVIVCDGQKGLIKAIYDVWPDTVIQRCLIHIHRQAKAWLTQSPKSEAGKELLCIVKNLINIETDEQKKIWLDAFNTWLNNYDDFLKEHTYHSTILKRWWYTHKKLRATRSLLKNSLDNLFIYIDDRRVPRTSNDVEGGINSRIKDLLRIHRGLKPQHQQVLVSWYLAKRQGQKPTQNYH